RQQVDQDFGCRSIALTTPCHRPCPAGRLPSSPRNLRARLRSWSIASSRHLLKCDSTERRKSRCNANRVVDRLTKCSVRRIFTSLLEVHAQVRAKRPVRQRTCCWFEH